MGNASSNALPQGNVADADDDDGHDDGGNSSGGSVGGSMFRLPLYRGERDAFLPIDDCLQNNDDGGDCGDNDDGGYMESSLDQRRRQPARSRPPLLSVEPKLSSIPNNELISPLNNSSSSNHNRTSSAVTTESSPPSVVSSSDSSYGTCYSTLSSSSPRNNTNEERNSSKGYCGGSRLYSTYQNSSRGPTRNLLPVPLPKPIPKRDRNSGSSSKSRESAGLFDCINPLAAALAPASTTTPTDSTTITKDTTQQSQAQSQPEAPTRKLCHQNSSASLTSLFESCLRSPENDNDNEYYTPDFFDGSSDNGSYHSSTSYLRSNSAMSQTSQYSNYSIHSHNSYHRSAPSKSSLISAFSSRTSLASSTSYYGYTELEKSMSDGEEPTRESDLKRVRNYHVVTTAALPWMTGTAVNPLLRAAHLLRRNGELLREQQEKEEGGGVEEQMEQGVEKVGALDIRLASPEEGEEEDILEASSHSSIKVPSLLPGKEKMQQQHKREHDPDDVEARLKMDNCNKVGEPINEGSEYGNGSVNPPPETDDKFSCSSPSSPARSTQTDNDDLPSPQSPCSLDYSCFSFSEVIGTAQKVPAGSSSSPRDTISPLGDDDSLILSPFTPCEATLAAEKMAPLSNGSGSSGQLSKPNTAGRVTLVLPWLTDASDRCMLYGTAASSPSEGESDEKETQRPMFEDQVEQEAYIRSWLANEANMPEEAGDLNILFYPARYHKFYNSIFALGDICDLISDEAADVCILEEPEHLNWYRAPGCSSWSGKFRHCIGIIHTNYKAYARTHAPAGFLAAPLLAGVNSLVVQANCHRVVKLSGVLQEFDPLSECVENVHGIRETYLEEGRRRRMSTAEGGTMQRKRSGSIDQQRRAYFIGKLLWAKGFDKLLELQASYRERTGEFFEIDIFGSGPDEREIQRAFSGGEDQNDNGEEGSGGILQSLNKWSGSRRQRLPANFLGKSDHASLAGDAYSIFINPSLTEVLCTTTAEAIAMGKWAIVPSHPSNAFFIQFPNCLSYRNRREFASKLKYALNNDPPQLSEELANLLSWEEATLRCVHAAAISKRDAARNERIRRMKEGKTLKKTLSGLWSGSKGDLQAFVAPVSSPSSSSPTSSPSESSDGYGSVTLITP